MREENVDVVGDKNDAGEMSMPEQHKIYRLMAGRGREAQANMEETDRERLP